MVDRLDVAPVRIEDEGADVARVVLGPLARAAVVAVPGGGRDTVELGHRLVVGGGEREVEILGRRAAVRDEREVAAVAGHEDVAGPVALADLKPQHGRDRLVEATARAQVGDAQPEVVYRRACLRPARPMNRLDAVPVRVEQEAAVVVGRVLRPQSWLAVAPVARLGPTPPEGVDDPAATVQRSRRGGAS